MKRLSDIASALLPKWEPCEQCRSRSGWVKAAVTLGSQGAIQTERYTRCSCYLAHQARLKALVETAKDERG
jgi:hypothetical protein